MPCFRGTSISQVAQLKREIQYQVFHRRWNQKRAFFAIFPTAGGWGGSHKGSAIHPIFYCPFPEWSCSVSLCAADLSWPTADMEMGLRFYGPNGLDTVKLRGHEYWMLFLLPFYVIHCQYIINRWYHIQNYWTKHYRAVCERSSMWRRPLQKIHFKWYYFIVCVDEHPRSGQSSPCNFWPEWSSWKGKMWWKLCF